MNRSELLPIEQAVSKKVKKLFDSHTDSTFVIGVSGGIDSLCLLHMFKRLNINASVVHINYQKRGQASHKDAELVRETARKWGFQTIVKKVDPSRAQKQNFQQWARQKRYETFRQIADEINAEGIALAHHKDDQIETVLQKMFRGAGLESWTAMDVWDGELFRPLLDVSRSQIEDYVQLFSVPYRTDESNLRSAFARNFLRNEWLVQMSDFFPGWKQNILRIPQQADLYAKALSWIAKQITDDRGIRRTKFDELHSGLQKALVLHLMKQQKQGIEVSRNSLDRLEELAKLQPGKKIELSLGFSIMRGRDHYIIKRETSEDFRPVKIERSHIHENKLKVANLILSLEPFEGLSNVSETLYLDAKKISWPIVLRRWRSGDSFQPLGMKGHQRISDHLTNRKISPAQKKQALVVESFEETISAVIFPPIKKSLQPGTISESVKCDENTRYCLKINH
jgi:tRNA(Ile)-lysidine synthase